MMRKVMHNLRKGLMVGSFVWLLSAIPGYANEQSDPSEWIVQNAPDVYVVQDGDTLWDISCMFLKDPWRWKQVWNSDPTLENPNTIYPGDKLHLRRNEGTPQICLERGRLSETVDKRTGIVKVRPRIRAEAPDNPIPTIPLNVIGPFFNKARVINLNQAHHSPCVVALEEDHILVGVGDRLFVSGLSPRILEDVFSVVRPGKSYTDPFCGAYLGVEAMVLGKAEREVAGDPSRWILSESEAEVRVGDRLLPTLDQELEAYFVPKPPQAPADGNIISVFDGLVHIGQYQIVVVTGGEDKCREVGDVLAIVQYQKDLPSGFMFSFGAGLDYPPMKIGQGLIFRVFEKVSYMLVMDATRTIYLLDSVASP